MLKRRQIRAIKRAFRKLFKRTWNWATTVSKSVIDWFLRSVLLMGVSKGRQNYAKAGFVLPTVIMLLLVVTLVVATLLVRTQNRTSQVIGAREEQVIYNAATPAIERAKAKLEYLFTQDTRLPFAPASDQLLLQMLVNNTTIYPNLTTPLPRDPYTFEGEQRIDLNGDGISNNDPAWAYETDVDNDGRPETVVYGIYLRSRSDNQTISVDSVGGRYPDGRAADPNPNNDTDENKARALVTRNGPINTINLNDRVCASFTQPGSPPPPNQILPVDESVWYPAGSGILRKTFQVDAIVVSSKQGTSRTVATLEFQQDRQLDRANKWGAWFRYDLDLYPGVSFNWNGAMYSGGNLFVGSSNLFRAFLISAPKSCFYGKDSSEIAVMQEPERSGQPQGFQGQFQANRVFDGNGGVARFDLQEEGGNNTAPVTDPAITTFNIGNDSVGSKPSSLVALDPVALFTQDVSLASGGQTNNSDARIATWDNTAFVRRGRFRNNQQNAPYVDDTYRADNRWGPKPKYDRVNQDLWLDSATRKNGRLIPNNLGDPNIKKLINNTVDPISDPERRTLGLDGYWERRAWLDGARIIVSPRLELGNTFGWVNRDLTGANGSSTPNQIRNDPSEIDPLYPVDIDASTNPPGRISHEQQQRRTLRDNLAAVQATVVYHQSNPDDAGNTPLACVATTAHPGTQRSDEQSRNFQLPDQRYWYPGEPTSPPNSPPLVSDFFYGVGTNGWEFTAPRRNDFNLGTPLRTALQNLANFTGDYADIDRSGAYPPTQERGRVFPNRYLTMWGDFSNLKRALSLSADNSIADNSYIHSAGCALGMLAYNINYFFNGVPNYENRPVPGSTLNWRNTLDALADVLRSPSVLGNTNPFTPNEAKPDDFLERLDRLDILPNDLPPTFPGEMRDLNRIRGLARFVHLREQINRDRLYGFANSPQTPARNNQFTYQLQFLGKNDAGEFISESFDYAGQKYSTNATLTPGPIIDTINVGCNFGPLASNGNNWFGLGNPATWTAENRKENERRFIVLATSLCSTQPKFPSLYYLFPTVRHDRIQVPPTTPPVSPQNWLFTGNPNTDEPYLNPPAPYNIGYPTTEIFDSVEPTNIAMVNPKGEGNWTNGNNNAFGSWYLPTDEQPNPTPPGDNDFRNDFWIRTPGGNRRFTSLIDTAFFDGREMMTVRALSIDLNLFRRGQIRNDNWLPKSGIIYAFREDAVREDGISRSPDSTKPNNNTIPNRPIDPQLETNGISPKPVDFFPDPERRPYGFRLQNGQDLRRFINGAPDNDNTNGLTFVSDNPVYIQGDFNLHSTDGTASDGTLLEEFRTRLQQPQWNNFYTREDLDPRFARVGIGNDTWRPSEILSDAVTILSNNFRKGYIDIGIANDTSNAPAIPDGRHSFRAINGPNRSLNNPPGQGWLLENGTVRSRTPWTDPPSLNDNRDVPIKLSRNGNPMFCNTVPNTPSRICPAIQVREYTQNMDYRGFITDYRNAINEARNTRVNSIIVSGIVPTRTNQSNGGFHNFPRFIENWNGFDSIISGSFIQLNFSTYATGPFNQSAWEPETGPIGSAPSWFYQPPNRIWGYDVGLQYAPPGALAKRFVTSGRKRSEFYRDLQVDDPYVCRLRRALNSANRALDPASLRECPN
ncbi:MAG: hormogonium polysaccharide biosynthesis protein HpsA [Phormidium sp.]